MLGMRARRMVVLCAAVALAVPGWVNAPAQAEEEEPSPVEPVTDLLDAVFESNPVLGGPIVLAGIDAEDGGPGGHGPIENYVTLVQTMLDGSANGGSRILAVGAGKGGFDGPTRFWQAIGQQMGVPVDLVNGAEDIAATPLGGYALIGIVSSQLDTYGGLTQAENDALVERSDDVASFVNGGGGLLGFSARGLTRPYGYVSGLFDLSVAYYDTSNIYPTPEGEAVGIDDALDVCCWHERYTSYPDFFDVLATYDAAGEFVAALGGQRVRVCEEDGLDGAGGLASGTVHEQVEPAVTELDAGAGDVVHEVNCSVVAPLEQQIEAGPQGPGPAPDPDTVDLDGLGREVVRVLAPSSEYREGFESGLGGWTVEGGVWEAGEPTSGPGQAHTGAGVLATVLDGNYPNGSLARVSSPPIDLSGLGSRPEARFSSWFDSEAYYDCGYLEISTDDGASWSQVTPVEGYGSSVNCGSDPGAGSFSGNHTPWSDYTIDLSDHADEVVQLRFVLRSDYSYTRPGWYIDEVVVAAGES